MTKELYKKKTKWLIGIRIEWFGGIFRMNEEKTSPNAKIIVVGLANAGKTSIIKSLMKQFDMLSIIKPTLGVNRETMEFLGRDLYFWDFGGQDVYRDRYLNEPELYFGNVSFVFYVVDIQNAFLLDVAIKYFQRIYDPIIQMNKNPKFVFLFHKADPDFNIMQKGIDVKQKFLETVTQMLIKDKKEYSTYLTSIHNPHSIISAVSEPLIEQIGLKNNVSEILKSFCETYRLSYGIIFTESYFEMGMYTIDEKIDGLLKNYLKDITAEHQNKPIFDIYYETIQVVSSRFSIKYKGYDLFFYLVVGFEETKSIFHKDRLSGVIEDLSKNFQKLFQNIDLERAFTR